MHIKKIVRPHRTSNKCKHCRISHLCLPARLNKKRIKQLPQLNFKHCLLKPGQHLFRQGEKLDHLYAIRSGILKSYTIQEDGREYVMGFHLPPDLFGWEGIDSNQLSVSVVALDSSNVCQIPLTQLETLLREIPELEAQLLQLVSKRIKNDNLAQLRTSSEQRVASFILHLISHYTLLGYPYYFCKLLMTHQDIANYLRIAPETISRTFHTLQSKGLINLSKKTIYVNDLKKLKEIAT